MKVRFPNASTQHLRVLTLPQVAHREKKSQGQLDDEEWDFAALENARVVKDAEQYYRAMFFRGLDCTSSTLFVFCAAEVPHLVMCKTECRHN